MSRNAYLPCFKCSKVLPNVFEDCDNQPYGGTEFRTEGHYGSTFWDSFDGEELVLNICDDCLREHSDRLGQQKRWMPVRCAGLTGFGRVDVDRPLVAYSGNSDDSSLTVGVDDLGGTSTAWGVQWVDDIAEMRADLEARNQ